MRCQIRSLRTRSRRVVVVVHRAIRRRPPQARLRARVRLVREPRVVQVVHVPLVRAEQGRRGLRGYLQHRGDPRHGVPLALAHLRRVEAPKRHRGRLVLARGDVAERLLVQDQILVRVRAGHRVEVVRRVVFIVARVGVAHRAAPARAPLDWRPDLGSHEKQQQPDRGATRVRVAYSNELRLQSRSFVFERKGYLRRGGHGASSRARTAVRAGREPSTRRDVLRLLQPEPGPARGRRPRARPQRRRECVRDSSIASAIVVASEETRRGCPDRSLTDVVVHPPFLSPSQSCWTCRAAASTSRARPWSRTSAGASSVCARTRTG